MKKNFMWKLCFALLALPFVVSCSEEIEEPTPTIPEVSITAGTATTESLTFTLTSKDAEEVKWLCYEKSESAPDAATVLSTGTAAEANKSVEITATGLTPSTEYVLVAVAKNDASEVMSEKVEMTTGETPTPTVALEFVEAGETTIKFELTTTNAEEVKWVYIEKDSREVTAEQVLQNGTMAEANTTVEVEITNLEVEVEYEIYAAAKAGEKVVLGEVLNAKTVYVPKTTNFISTEVSVVITGNNYYFKFENATSSSYSVDVYAALDSEWLPSGTYDLALGSEPGGMETRYTRFWDNDKQSSIYFAEGLLTVVATPNEETLEIMYDIEGNFTTDKGDIYTLKYEGLIDGISLPTEGGEPGEMETIEFIADPTTDVPYRRSNGGVDGEYILVFTDADWGELILDIYTNLEDSDNGNGHLPDGTYTIADGSVDTYSQVVLYEPSYWYANFAECTITVSRVDETYTIGVDGILDDSGTQKRLIMNYTGVIEDMVRTTEG